MDRRNAVIMLFFVLFTALVSATFYQISFRGIEVSQTSVEAGETINFTTNLVNMDDAPYTDVIVTAQLIRETDRTRVARTTVNSDVDLAAREVTAIRGELTVPEDAPGGSYTLNLQALTPIGIPMTFMSEDLDVTNPDQVSTVRFGRQGVYLVSKKVVTGDNIITTYSLPSFGSQGENVLPDTSFDIKFSLTNTGTTDMDLQADVEIVPTYSTQGKPVKSLTRDLGTLNLGSTEQYSITTSVSDPGTYVVNVAIRDGQGRKLGENQVRLVIAGAGGSILNVANSKDIYSQGETVNVDAQIVGPADGSTIVRNSYLRLEILKEGNTVVEKQKTVDKLPFNPTTRTFSFQAPTSLQNYRLRVVLGKGDRVFDTFEAQYQNLVAERVLTDSGQVRKKGACFDNGKCTSQEYQIGTCYDCRNVEQPPQKVSQDTGNQGEEQQGRSMPVAQVAGLVIVIAVVAASVLYARRMSQ